MLTIPSQSASTVTSTAQTLGDSNLNGTSHIPEELLVDEIFVRLPVKFLLRLRCVCKQWCSVIDSTNFVKKHLQRNIECNPNSGIIFRAYPHSRYLYLEDVDSRPVGNNFYLEDVDSLYDSTAIEVADPLKSFLSGVEYVGSCNGLVCLWKNESDVLLWNPAMRKARELPTPNNIPLPLRLIGSSVLGFGYDHLNDDYKVLRTCDSQIHGIMVSVYSLKNNSWTRAETITNRIRLMRKFGLFANGSLYWLAHNDSHFYPSASESGFIVAFDLGVERHRELPLPAGVDKNEENGIGVIVSDRCLCLMDHNPDSRTDIWLMNDNGLGNSWSKLLSVEQAGILGGFEIAWPVAFSKTRNEFLLVVDEDKLMWYNSVRNEVKNITVHGCPVPFDLLIYTESLVRLTYDVKLDGKQTEGKKQKKQQKNKMSDYLSKGFKLKL